MQCYSCAEQGVDRPAVALGRACSAGLCLDHLRDTAAPFASDHMLAPMDHDQDTPNDSD